MKSTIIGLKIISVLLVIALTVALFFFWQFTSQSTFVPPPIATSSSGQQAVAAIAQLTVTPDNMAGNELSTAMPYQHKYELGDAELLKTGLNQLMNSNSLDLRVTSKVKTGGAGAYCIAAHTPTDWDPNIPLADHIQQGRVFLYDSIVDKKELKMTYCHFVGKLGTLNGGVLQSDLQDIENRWQFIPVENQQVDPDQRVVNHTEQVDVIITVRFGFFNQSVQEGNSIPKTMVEPDLFLRNLSEKIQNWTQNNQDFWVTQMDEADRFSDDLATMDLIAPFQPDGSRSTEHLDELFREMNHAFNNPSPYADIAWPYDNLFVMADHEAQRAGYSGVRNLTIVLVWPYEQGVWYKLESIGSTNPQPVIDPSAMEQYKHNLYSFFTQSIPGDWNRPQWPLP